MFKIKPRTKHEKLVLCEKQYEDMCDMRSVFADSEKCPVCSCRSSDIQYCPQWNQHVVNIDNHLIKVKESIRKLKAHGARSDHCQNTIWFSEFLRQGGSCIYGPTTGTEVEIEHLNLND